MTKLIAFASLLLSPLVAFGAVKTETVEYKDGDVTLKGFVAYDDAQTGRRPGVLVVPEWWGLTDYAKDRAKQLAGLGYVAFAADYYGNGQTVNTPQEAGKLAGALKGDAAAFRSRGMAALAQLKARPDVDPAKLAAVGYCFGGSAVLELARGGADLAGVVSFHGSLGTKQPAGPGGVKPAVLVLHGADDPMVKPDEVRAFDDEMRAAGADYQIVAYGDAVHSFSNPKADAPGIPGVAYNEKADKRSWETMKAFLAEVLK